MEENKNVPIAVLSCFLIAFILQGILKLCGIFVFEKALNWEIFKIIDNTLWLQIIYYSILNLILCYCFSFSLTNKPYSNKWYHYLIIVFGVFLITSCRILLKAPFFVEFIYDALLYIVTPIIINLTTNYENKIDNKSFTDKIITLSIQILLYFLYLGLSYWSNILNSLLPINQTVLSASSMFLIKIEIYLGIILIMISLNIFIKRRN